MSKLIVINRPEPTQPPVVNFRKSNLHTHQIDNLRRHAWYMGESDGIISLRPEGPVTVYEAKKFLRQVMNETQRRLQSGIK